LLGPASFEGGLPTAWLGAALHYFIATAIVVVYYAASLRLPALVRRQRRRARPVRRAPGRLVRAPRGRR